MKISANEIKPGMLIEHKNDLWEVLKTQHVKPGKGGAFNQVEMKSVNKNTKMNERFRSSETVEKAAVEESKYSYLYKDENNYYFMHTKTFEQININKKILNEKGNFLSENLEVTISFYDDKPISVELTYGLERICMFVQEKSNVFDILWNKDGTLYKDIYKENEKQFSKYNFELANIDYLFNTFESLEKEAKNLLLNKLPLPAYDHSLKASHVFNILDSRGAISTAQRAGYISRIRDLVKEVGLKWLEEKK